LNASDVSPASHSIEEGEEEEESVIKIRSSASIETSGTPESATPESVPVIEPWQNPSRARKPPDKWTY